MGFKPFFLYRAALLTALFLLKTNAFAMADGRVDSTFKGVVRLQGQVGGDCTGTFVGMNPPTILTAAHCVYSQPTFSGIVPSQMIYEDFNGQKIDLDKGVAPGDLAILIFRSADAANIRTQLGLKPEDLFTVAPVSLKLEDTVSICGFGGMAHGGQRVCGQTLLVTEDFSLQTPEEQFFADNNKTFMTTPFNSLTESQKVGLLGFTLIESFKEFGPGTRYGVARLTPDAFKKDLTGYDSNGASSVGLEPGDSGGPWFVKDSASLPHIFGVSSLSAISNVYGLAWRLDHPWSKALLKKALDAGADIKGINDLLK